MATTYGAATTTVVPNDPEIRVHRFIGFKPSHSLAFNRNPLVFLVPKSTPSVSRAVSTPVKPDTQLKLSALHGVLKKGPKTVMSSIIRSMGSTLGACGDLNRNVLAPAAPIAGKDYLFAQETAENIAAVLTPQSGFYHDMWVDGERIMTAEPPEVVKARTDNTHGTNFPDSPEPIYGTQFLPRKFKIAVTVPGDNSVDILTNDIATTVITNDPKIRVHSFIGFKPSHSLAFNRNPHVFLVPKSTPSVIRAVSTPVKPDTATETKRSKVEIIKEGSNYIRYPLNEELLTDAPNINEAATQLIKFHGSYQQYNRDERGARSYSFMLRTKNPCGKVSNKLYLTMDDLADQFGIGTLRLTTRQTFQLHGVLKKDLKTVMSSIIRSMGSTLGACGDLNRNVLAPAAPIARKDYLFAQETAENIAALLTPQSGFYYDMWVDGERIMTAEPPEEVQNCCNCSRR
ncbi:hypothetical protein SLEP1_g32151 [Rubroshorea leprosula]|uniref:Uncharacterized protein n=1 Tax=Rubroshorea leprosula TaxID=152421 RepID=A0AAV5KCH7_9ROSI|nr:hypothetical protein SLEP1_g32151 [Rubroshorea leprosula]